MLFFIFFYYSRGVRDCSKLRNRRVFLSLSRLVYYSLLAFLFFSFSLFALKVRILSSNFTAILKKNDWKLKTCVIILDTFVLFECRITFVGICVFIYCFGFYNEFGLWDRLILLHHLSYSKTFLGYSWSSASLI